MSHRITVKIFIASSGELEAERKESVLSITELNKRYLHLHLEPVLFEFDTPAGNVELMERIQDAINPKLEESHIAVILFYTKVGKFTLEELDLALKLDKKVFVYFKEGFIPESIGDLNKYKKVLSLKSKMDKKSAIRYQKYKTLQDYYGSLYKELGKYLDEVYPSHSNESTTTTSSSNEHIPLAPRPYLAHPYAIVKNFTGRREEIARLTEWFKYDKEPMCIIEAIGGMGKSALCWRWLLDEVIANNTDVEGIIWWSFYDQGFEDFIHHLYEYCIPEEVRNLKQRIDETTEVISALTNHKFLLVLDGFERVLRGYAQMMAMYIQEEGLSKKTIDDIKGVFDVQQRTPVSPKAEKFLRALCTGNSKMLMTTRLYPASIDGLAGVKHIKLTGLSKTDTIAFFKAEGITGTDEEMIKAGEVYGFHPLMLKLLSTAIKRSFTPDIKKALQEAFSKGLIDEREPKKILGTSFQLLNPDEQKVVSTISVFRTAFTFDAVEALFPDMDSAKLEGIMIELCNLGFLLYNEQQHLFDFHPILRSYLYDGLTGKDTIHELAITYFAALPTKEKIVTLADVEPVIEQCHHLVRASKYQDAVDLFHARLFGTLYHQLAQYDLCISLCELVPRKPAHSLSKLSNDSHSDLLNMLSLCYAAKGQLNKANESLLIKMSMDYEANNDENLGVGLRNLSELVYVESGKLSQAQIQLLKGAALLKTIDPFHEGHIYRVLGQVSTMQTRFQKKNEEFATEEYLAKVMSYCIDNQKNGLASSVALEYTKYAIGKINIFGDQWSLAKEALNWSLKSVEYAEVFRISSYPDFFYFFCAYESMSRALIPLIQFKIQLHSDDRAVLYYDENFEKISDKVTVVQGNYLDIAARCVSEGLNLSRKTNSVYKEGTFSLLFAQIEWLKIIEKQREIEQSQDIEKILIETRVLAEKIGYRMLLTDLHLFCAEVLIKLNEMQPGHKQQLLGCDVKEHLQKVREYALDTSDINDIFLPPDGTADEFYKDIPEYFMLKRGMTDEERIKNGYYAAWLRADKLEEKLKG